VVAAVRLDRRTDARYEPKPRKVGIMPRRSTALAKKSLVVDSTLLGELIKVGGYRNESEAVRAAVASAVAIRRMQDAIAGLQGRGTFGRRLR
jgi:hypothetical protein